MKFELAEVAFIEEALIGMRNPMNSWACGDTINSFGEVVVGENDMRLATTLIKSGSDHRKFLRQIPVIVQITAPQYWWAEMSTYKVGTVANSTSKMHKLKSTKITPDCFQDFVPQCVIDRLEGLRTLANLTPEGLCDLIANDCYLYGYPESTDPKVWWKRLLNELPEGWLQTRMWSANYETLRNIYHARKNHKLTEWHEFCKWVESLPYAKEFIITDYNKKE